MQPNISIIVPVYNELNINSHLQTLPLEDPLVEVIVSDGHPEATTLACIAKHLSVGRVHSTPGRGNGLVDGAAAASGKILLFLHGDTKLPIGAVDMIADTLRDPNIVGGAFDLGIDAPEFKYRIIEKISSWRSRLTRIPYGDQAIFIRKETYDRVGGYKRIPLLEEVDLMRRLKKQGFKIKIIPAKVRTSARRWQRLGVVGTTVRNWYIITLYYLGASPHTLAEMYK